MAIAISLMHTISGKKAIRRKKKEKIKEEVEKTVYLCADVNFNFNNGTDWYVIKLSSKDWSKKNKRKRKKMGREKEPLYTKPIVRNMALPRDSCFVAVGSTIYCTGSAAKDISSDVLACDTTSSNNFLQWEAVAAMNLKRECPFSVVSTGDDGKMYVFGGCQHYYSKYMCPNGYTTDKKFMREFMCEVFNPRKDEWEPISPSPPSAVVTFIRTALDLFAVYDAKLRRIILGSSLIDDVFLVTYGVKDGTWTLPPEKKFIASPLNGPHIHHPAFSDNTLYWIKIHGDMHYCGVYAYDMDQQMLLYGTIIGVHPYFWDNFSCSMQLYHIRGDKFYLIWLDNFKLVRFETLRISKRIDLQKQQGSLTARVLSTKTYRLDTEAHNIRAVLL